MSASQVLCSCEMVGHGKLGTVLDSEQLARVITSPNHVRKDGSLKPGAFPPTHIKRSGVSVVRTAHVTVKQMVVIADAIAGNKAGEKLSGIAVCKASAIRSIRNDNEERSLCLFDDPVEGKETLPDNPAHAIIIGSNDFDHAEILRLQGELLKLFGAPQDIPSALI